MSNRKFRKVLAIALAVSLAAASLPMAALPVYAEEGTEIGGTKVEVTADNVNDYIEVDSSVTNCRIIGRISLENCIMLFPLKKSSMM